MSHRILFIAACLAGLAVALGAFGAHALKGFLESNGHASTYATAVQYHFYHALGLLALGGLLRQAENEGRPTARLKVACWLLVAGVLMFSGSLYALALTGIEFFGPVTPLGGVAFLAGWGVAAFALLKSQPES